MTDYIFEATIARSGEVRPDGKFWSHQMLLSLVKRINEVGFKATLIAEPNLGGLNTRYIVVASFPIDDATWQKVLNGESVTLVPSLKKRK
jgi:hypothetical protein